MIRAEVVAFIETQPQTWQSVVSGARVRPDTQLLGTLMSALWSNCEGHDDPLPLHTRDWGILQKQLEKLCTEVHV